MDYTIELPILEDFQSHENIFFIDEGSKSSQKEALELMASYFKKEFNYDHLQYCKDDNNIDCIGVLFVEIARDQVKDFDHHPHRVVGGACFRNKGSETYKLDWIWFHPFARNRKKLKNHWEQLKTKFGDFTITEPLSAHMAKFVEKYA